MKYLFFLFFLSLTFVGLAQSGVSYDRKLEALIALDNQPDIFKELLEKNIEYIDDNRKASFTKAIEELNASIKNEAVKYFKKKYDLQDINKIYAELSEKGKIAYYQKTLSFLREWRSYKRKYQKEFNRKFIAFQQ